MTILFGTFFLLLILRVPIAFCLFISSLFYMVSNDIPLTVVTQRLIAGVDSFPLLAVPMFILAGEIMNVSGITTRLFTFAERVLGHFTGGLAYANVLASVIFSGMSGSAIADVGGLGAVELKAMRKAKYKENFSLAITGASSVIGPIIPPSVPVIVFAAISDVSIGRLFLGGIIPGLIMAIALCIMIYIYGRRKGLPKHPRSSWKELYLATKEAFLPLLTPVIVLAGIFTGIFTPTEIAGVTVLYALFLGFLYKSFTLRELPTFLITAGKTTINVSLIVSCAAVFGWILASEQIPQMLSQYFVGYISSEFMALIIINMFLLIIGTFMDNSAAIPILTPVLLPLAISYGIDPVHFGIIMILNLMIGLITPPVGLVLYVLSSVSSVPFERISKAIAPFVIALVIVLLIVSFVPQLVLFIPNLILGSP
ncbi:TRAP transporter large permease [Ammoniphilus resinae]|uniref:Tripartite ATP-independent transporter DctM subunit n=1 Tax=Ammoniphilus resinae TaxID=861532 RepID=A0ABS4GSR6_9BACL|nr:TRAP transporter large permease [Ammoniphilus resinae]MBP1933332.1 tripartite ATP-independent transporter DctM subunit [Ammoniphilus resinae]